MLLHLSGEDNMIIVLTSPTDEPVQQIPEREQWLFDPKNKEILKRLKKSLEEKPTIKFSEFKKTLKTK